jgi:hypothetical protein
VVGCWDRRANCVVIFYWGVDRLRHGSMPGYMHTRSTETATMHGATHTLFTYLAPRQFIELNITL